MTEEQLAALLRLKRYEQPPAGYYDQLLRDIRERQRAELLQRPLWRIALERIQTAFGEHSIGGWSYAGAMAATIVLGITSIHLLTPAEVRLASETSPPRDTLRSSQPRRLLSLQNEPLPAASVLAPQPFVDADTARDLSRFPRYVIDARPASYEPSFKF